jgi:hypothetical protein
LASQWSSQQQQQQSLQRDEKQQQQQQQQQELHQNQRQLSQQEQQQLLQQAQQLQDWLQELRCMESAAAAAALQVVHDPSCSPQLLINAVTAQQHPLWAADYAAWQTQQTQQQPTEQQQQQQQEEFGTDHKQSSRRSTQSQSNRQSNSFQLQVLLPPVAELDICGNTAIPVAAYYAAAIQSAPDILQICPTPTSQTVGLTTLSRSQQQQAGDKTADSAASAAVVSNEDPNNGSCMPWSLTAAATLALLASPPGLLSQQQLQAVHVMGLTARLQVLAAAIDLQQMLQAEACNTEVGAIY